MTDLLSDLTTPSDAELISSVRGGDVAAYGELFARHRDAANRLARQLMRGPDADDLVSEAFAKVLSVLQGGGGPDVAFRAYLLTAVRRLHVDRMRSVSKVQASDDMDAFDLGVPFVDTAIASFESGAAAKAFATLPERWQLVLWHLEVEGNKPADIAPLLGMSPNSVSALAYRAREGLRQAFLTMHLNDISDTDCRWVNEHLGAFVRKGLSNRDSTKVQAHLDQCRRCTAMYLELTEVNSNLAAIIAPLLLGAAGAGYLASGSTAVGGLGLMSVVGRVRDLVTANAGPATAGGVAAGVAAVTTAGVMLLPGTTTERVIGADDPVDRVAPSARAVPGPTQSQDRLDRTGKPPASPVVAVPVALPGDPATTGAPSETPTDVPSAPPSPAPSDEPTGEPTPEETPTASPSDEATPSPAPTPAPAPTVSFAVDPVLTGGSVSFVLNGGPLPPVVQVDVSSDPAGITFGSGGASCTLTSPTSATCPTGSTGGAALARTSTASANELSVTLPLSVPPGQRDSAVTLTVSAAGVAPTSRTFAYNGVADVGLTALTPDDPQPGNDGLYHLGTSLLGVEGLPHVVLQLPDYVPAGVTIQSGSGCVVQDARTLMCHNPTDRQVVDLVLAAPTDAVTPLSVSIAAPADYDEIPNVNVNTVGTDLQPAPVVVALAFTSGPTATLISGNRHTVTATVQLPAGTTSVEFVLPDNQQAFEPPVEGCTVNASNNAMTCPINDGVTSLWVSFDAKLPASRGDLEVRVAGSIPVREPIGPGS